MGFSLSFGDDGGGEMEGGSEQERSWLPHRVATLVERAGAVALRDYGDDDEEHAVRP